MQYPIVCPLCDQEAESISHILTEFVFRVRFDTMFSDNGSLHPLSPQPGDAFNSWFQSAAERAGLSKIKGACTDMSLILST